MGAVRLDAAVCPLMAHAGPGRWFARCRSRRARWERLVVVALEFAVSSGSGGSSLGRSGTHSQWARDREAEGWAAITVGDHVTSGGMWAHPLVVLGAMASATTRVRLATSFSNNLVRSPVEFAQAAVTLQSVSAGRFEAGLGAGWHRGEIEAIGLDYPEPAQRARRYCEALQIAGQLLRTGSAVFSGDHYEVNTSFGSVPEDPPPLVGAVAGHWSARHVPPLVDRVEVLPFPQTSRAGAMLEDEVASISTDDIRRVVDLVRESAANVPISFGCFVAVGTPQATAPLAGLFASGLAAGLIGPAEKVATTLRQLEVFGVDRISVIPLIAGQESDLIQNLLA
jgi:alkanesulfonate monooxygenase SsuD/methylene tetrahydromethanopterin reductase-like flavin-dependent oxidoreductase (luciferase family)